MDNGSNQLKALAQRVSGRIPAEALAHLVQSGADSVTMQRKTLTLLFVDTTGIPAGLGRLRRAFEAELEWLAGHYQGIRDRFTPSGVLVFFAEANACVRMAIELQRSGAPLRLRMGVTTVSCELACFSTDGEAFVTLLGAEGDIAAQVAAGASGGSIQISPSTYALVREAVHADSRDCLLAEEMDDTGAMATVTPAPTRGGPDASTFAGLGLL